jgi:hypothetical protein
MQTGHLCASCTVVLGGCPLRWLRSNVHSTCTHFMNCCLPACPLACMPAGVRVCGPGCSAAGGLCGHPHARKLQHACADTHGGSWLQHRNHRTRPGASGHTWAHQLVLHTRARIVVTHVGSTSGTIPVVREHALVPYGQPHVAHNTCITLCCMPHLHFI